MLIFCLFVSQEAELGLQLRARLALRPVRAKRFAVLGSSVFGICLHLESICCTVWPLFPAPALPFIPTTELDSNLLLPTHPVFWGLQFAPFILKELSVGGPSELPRKSEAEAGREEGEAPSYTVVFPEETSIWQSEKRCKSHCLLLFSHCNVDFP
jgi:hypothetical protein